MAKRDGADGIAGTEGSSEATQFLLELLAAAIGEVAAGLGVLAGAEAGAKLRVPVGEAFALECLAGLLRRGAAHGAEGS